MGMKPQFEAELDKLREHPMMGCGKCSTFKGQPCKCAENEKVEKLREFIRGLSGKDKVPCDSKFLNALKLKEPELHTWLSGLNPLADKKERKICEFFAENVRIAAPEKQYGLFSVCSCDVVTNGGGMCGEC